MFRNLNTKHADLAVAIMGWPIVQNQLREMEAGDATN
jgi:hypothetical protein